MCSKDKFVFVIAKFLGISSNTVRLYINSGKIFKDRYKFVGARSAGNPEQT